MRATEPAWHCYRHGMSRTICACAPPHTRLEPRWVDSSWQDYATLPIDAGEPKPSPTHEVVWRCSVFAPGLIPVTAGWHPVRQHAVHDAIELWNALDVVRHRCGACRSRACVRLHDRDGLVCLVCGHLHDALQLAARRA